MDQITEIKTTVASALSESADDLFSAAGFTRRSGGLRYERKLGGCVQQVDVSIEYGPKDSPKAAAAIYPWLSVRIDAIDTLAIQMTGGDESLLSSKAPTLHQPIEWLSQKEQGARWFLYQPDSVDEAILGFAVFSEKWVLPFLSEYVDEASVVAMFKAKDGRVIYDQGQVLRVVSAMVRLGNLADAREVLKYKFGRPANRRKFARVFEFIEENSASSST